MVFQFEVMDIDSGGAEGGAEAVSPLTCRDWHVLELKNVVEKWQQYKREEGYWNTCVPFPVTPEKRDFGLSAWMKGVPGEPRPRALRFALRERLA